mgnify:CR=1 FL=1
MVKKVNKISSIVFRLFGFIFIFGLFLRVWGVLHGNFAYTYDVGRDFLEIHKQVYEHNLSLLGPTSGQGGVFYGPWWYWLMAVPFFILGGNPTGMVLTIVVSGLLAVVLAFFWGRKFVNDYFGLLLAGVLSFSPYFIGTTSQFWNPNLLIFVTLAVMVLLSQITKLNYWWMFVFGFLTTLAIELQLFFGTFLFVSIFLCLLIFQKKIFFSRKILPFFLGVFIVELPRVIFEKKNDFLQTKVLLNNLSSNITQQYDFFLRTKILGEFLNAVWPIPVLMLVAVLSIIVLALFVRKIRVEKERDKRFFFLGVLLTIIIYCLVTLFYKKDFWNYYLTGLPVILLIPLGVVFSDIANKFSKKGLLLIMVFVLSFLRPADIWQSIKVPKFVGDASVYRNQVEVVDYLYQDADGENFNVTVYTPPVYSYTWDYLFLWYGKKHYGSLPETKKAMTKLYLVIEPDPGYEGRVTNWLKVREGDGQIIKEKTFPSGIIVQSRFRSL